MISKTSLPFVRSFLNRTKFMTADRCLHFYKTLILFLSISLFGVSGLSAQILRQDRPESKMQQERLADEQLANQFYQLQEWERAAVLYNKLYQQYQLQHYYQFYLNCLIELRDYKTAEKVIKQYTRKNQRDIQSEVDLGYILQLSGETSKSKKVFESIIDAVTTDNNRTLLIANAFRSRMLFDYALKAYEKGAAGKTTDNPFHMEMATIYQFTGQYDLMFDKYLDYAAANPNQVDLVKSRVQNLLSIDFEESLSEQFRIKLLQRAQSEPSNLLYGEMLVWFALQQKDFDMAMRQVQALDKRKGDLDYQVIELAEISLSNQQYDIALNGYNYLIKKGRNSMFYFNGIIGQLRARYLIAGESSTADRAIYEALSRDIDNAVEQIGFNQETYDLMLTQARIKAFQLGQTTEAIQLVNKVMELPLSNQELASAKMDLADLMLFNNEVWEATLLYSQIDKALRDAPLAHEARFRNARLRFYIGEFGWAQTQLNVLKSATSKLIANDAMTLWMLINDNLTIDTTGAALRVFARASMLVYRKKDNEALRLLDSLQTLPMASTLTDHIMMEKANIYLRKGNFQEVDSLYRQIAENFPESYLADDALFKRAKLNENQLGNIASARVFYEKLFLNYPASIFVSEARRKYRLLRGDAL